MRTDYFPLDPLKTGRSGRLPNKSHYPQALQCLRMRSKPPVSLQLDRRAARSGSRTFKG